MLYHRCFLNHYCFLKATNGMQYLLSPRINLKIDSSEKNKTFSNQPAKNLSSNHYYISHGKTKCCLDQKLIFLPMKKYYNCFKINVSFGYMCHWIQFYIQNEKKINITFFCVIYMTTVYIKLLQA